MLVRHGPEPGGWTWVTTDPGEAPLVGALHNVPNLTKVEAVKETTDLLETLADEYAYRVGIDPSGDGDVPGTDYWLGDAVEVEGDELRVGAFTISIDEARPGRTIYVPEVGQVVDPVEVRQANINKRMSNGTVGGRSRVAVPLGMTRGQSPGDSPDVPTVTNMTLGDGSYIRRRADTDTVVANSTLVNLFSAGIFSTGSTATVGTVDGVTWDATNSEFDFATAGLYEFVFVLDWNASFDATLFFSNGSTPLTASDIDISRSWPTHAALMSDTALRFVKPVSAGDSANFTSMTVWQNSGVAQTLNRVDIYVRAMSQVAA
jgi:hypothetical protein